MDTIGGMVEHQEDILSPNVAMAKEIITRIGDFTQMTPDDNVLNNIIAAATVFSSEGKRFHFIISSPLFPVTIWFLHHLTT